MSATPSRHVYPLALDLPDAADVPVPPAGARQEWGRRPLAECALCRAGICRQAIQSSPTWSGDCVVHVREPLQ